MVINIKGVSTTMSTAKRYNLAYNFLFEEQSKFNKNILINAGDGRVDRDVIQQFTKEVCRVAESDMKIPAVKCNYVVPQANAKSQPSGVK